ncbi:MAG TPA: polysaccharide biosynthesis tyrosine autokinase [Tepidisphaeraceae bacterium]|nr:polysaccharide biosynthesis tyrosine autokinase [Tepidisphaeraceae bacterium]
MISSLSCVLGTLIYQQFVPAVYPVKGSIELRGDAGKNASPLGKVAAADFSTRMINSVYSTDVLSDAIQRLSGFQFAILGTSGDPIQTLRDELQVSVDGSSDRLEIELDSPFRHEAAAVVNAVMDSLLSPTKPGLRAANGIVTLQPQMIAQVTSASADVEPNGVSPEMMIWLAAGCGIGLGLLIAVYLGVTDQRVRSPQQIEKLMGIHTAGYLPPLSGKSSPAGRGLAAYIDPTSEVALLCRSLLLKLFGATVSEQAGSLLITSPCAGEGRSTVSLNLAVTLALAGENVLLVDGNIQSPILHKLFAQTDSVLGLCESLDNPTSALEFVRPTHVNNLHLLSCGKPSSTAATKLQSGALKQVMMQLREKYRYVLIDSGPALGNPDTLALASRCSASLLVIHAQETRMADAVEARNELKQHGAKQLVAIVNALPNDSRRRYFHSQPPARGVRKASHESYYNVHDYGCVTS